MIPLMNTFSRPEISGWNPAPSSISAEIRPFTVTVPCDGLVIPATSLSIVLLPEPLRPMTPRVQPAGTVNDTSRTAVKVSSGLRSRIRLPPKQRALQRRELSLVPELAVDLRGVDDFDGVHGHSDFLGKRIPQPVEHPVGEQEEHRPTRRQARTATSNDRPGRRRRGSPDT